MLAIAVAKLTVNHISQKNEISTGSDYGGWHLGWKLMPLGQAFAEELVLRALLLGYLASFLNSKTLIGTAPVGDVAKVFGPGDPYQQAKRCFEIIAK